MRRIRGLVTVITVAVAVGGTVAGCHSSSKTGGQGASGSATAQASVAQTQAAQSQSPTPTAAASTSAAPQQSQPAAASVSVIGTTVATNIDPCQLVTAAEASVLAGTTYSSGMEQTSGNGKECIYGYQTTNVFTVEVVQADSAATAQAAWADAKAKADAGLKQQLPAGVTVNVNTGGVPGLGDQAATVYVSTSLGGQQVGLSGVYVLKGATFFAFQDLLVGHAPPTLAAMEAQATTDLGRI